jgi:hypothetical protein
MRHVLGGVAAEDRGGLAGALAVLMDVLDGEEDTQRLLVASGVANDEEPQEACTKANAWTTKEAVTRPVFMYRIRG